MTRRRKGRGCPDRPALAKKGQSRGIQGGLVSYALVTTGNPYAEGEGENNPSAPFEGRPGPAASRIEEMEACGQESDAVVAHYHGDKATDGVSSTGFNPAGGQSPPRVGTS